MRPTLSSASLLSFLAGAFAATAQDFGEPQPSTYVEPKSLVRVNPEYPASALSSGREGWVMLSFVISPTGDVVEPMIEQSSGGEPFERAALAAIARWKYAPATQDGVPVEQAMTKTIIRFQLETGFRSR